MEVVIYHNPRCSKSRKTLELLRSRNIEPQVIEYLETPPDRDTLADIVTMLNVTPMDLVRTAEPEFRDSGLTASAVSDDLVLHALSTCPRLLQRPIVLCGGKAAIGRPPENVLAIL